MTVQMGVLIALLHVEFLGKLTLGMYLELSLEVFSLA